MFYEGVSRNGSTGTQKSCGWRLLRRLRFILASWQGGFAGVGVPVSAMVENDISHSP